MPVLGKFEWEFEIPGAGRQTSVHEFFPGHIHYSMSGPAHSASYTQDLVSYDPSEMRCITKARGDNKDGVCHLMFFKDIGEHKITIYKRKCPDLKTAETFGYPEADTTEDHGWNTYTRIN